MKKGILTILTGIMMATAGGWSASVIKMDIDDLTKRSDVAVVGKVTSISHINEAGRYPETLFKMDVLEIFYGSEDLKQVTVCLPGGPAGNGLSTFVPGMPKFQMGEKVALFLVLDKARGVAVPTGLEQGVFRVKVHPETEVEYVVNQTVDIKLNSIGVPEASGESKKKSPSLSEFGKTVKEKAEALKKEE
jgi:hypothetical protein